MPINDRRRVDFLLHSSERECLRSGWGYGIGREAKCRWRTALTDQALVPSTGSAVSAVARAWEFQLEAV